MSANKEAKTTIVWLRQDLRLADHPALSRAHDRSRDGEGDVIVVYIWAPQEESPWEPGGASKVWLHQSLAKLSAQLEAIDSRLFIFDCSKGGSSLGVLQGIAAALDADTVYWTRRYEPAVIERDKKIKSALREQSLTVETFNGALLIEPWQISTKEGKPYQVFTPYWRACQMQLQMQFQASHNSLLKAPRSLPQNGAWQKTLTAAAGKKKYLIPVALDDLGLLPEIAWDKGIKESWQPGEKGALKQLDKFIQTSLRHYEKGRDQPALDGVSRMSPHLHFGEISPRTIWHKVSQQHGAHAASYLRELGWREFSHHLLYHFPETTDTPLRRQFNHFPWVTNKNGYQAWTRGLTGYPIVDAGMRELWQTGIMHNRVRMIVASFLVKDLLIPWQEGAAWFWDTLVDADLAQNTLGWQWTAGCGADAAPYFRIFNPILQGEKFDPDGEYVRRWVPELAALKSKWIHKPWLAPPLELAVAGLTLGENYPRPIVDHGFARDRALTAFKQLKETVKS